MPVGATDVNIYQHSSTIFDDVGIYFTKAVVFVDDASADVIHWHGAATMLFNCGALDIREFSSFESGNVSHPKAVFFINGPLSNVTVLDKIQAIIAASHFTEVVVFTTVCSPMHSIIEYGPAGVTDDDSRAFQLYRNQILDWMQCSSKTNTRCIVDLIYLPLVVAPVLPSLFILPAMNDVFPLLPTDLDFIRQNQYKGDRPAGQSEIDFACLPKQLQLKLKLLACSLSSFLEVIGCAEDIFALGQTSNIVASELAGLSWAKNRKKNAQRKASLLIVDRTLDIASVVGHFHETLLDKMISVLPRLPGHCTDVAVDMSPICSTVSDPEHRLIAPGCLGHPEDPVASSLLGALGVLKNKEALMEINRLLVEAGTKESHDVSGFISRPGRGISVDQLASQLQQFRGKESVIRRHCGLLQLAAAAVEVGLHPTSMRLDSLLAEEKGLLQCIGDEDSPSFIRQIIKNIRHQLEVSHTERTHTVDDILLLLTFVYSLTDAEHVDTESDVKELEKLLVQLLLDSREESGKILRSLESCIKIVQEAIKKLRNLYRARDGFKQYRDIYEPGSLSSQARLKPLLRQIVEDIVDPSRPELLDISHKSSGFGDLLKSGFGLFRSVGKPRPGDHPLLVIFVIGGVTSTEVRQVRDVIASSKTNIQVILGSTGLINPIDILHRLIVQDNLHPSSPS